MQIGNRIIFDQDGKIIYQLGEMEGNVLPRKEITKLDYIDLEYEQIDYSKHRIIAIDTETRQPILEEVIREKTQEEYIQELENQILLLEDEKLGGGIL
ncbi:hypothetical protein [Clostridium sp. Cult2]|uniref:hypothetical protein n=1 Tax=Clostridium sp. Cult2 TaxID=2079003 RepID=UPI001F3EDA5A|nr:hypothetical protein [Clostridium sp. Cult2]MCF6466333.1 hypothetical protein [Clostridium sp. Cult2]